MLRRVPQPPVDPSRRSLERHDFWPPFVTVIIGALLLLCGARHLTGIETVDGDTARETQLVKAFTFSGLKYPEITAPPQPRPDDPAGSAEALERWARENARRESAPRGKVRVDTGAAAPCPT